MARRRPIRILGGMSPRATVDFMQKGIVATLAERRQGRVPLVVCSVPRLPGPVSAASAGTNERFPAMQAGIRALEQSGVEAITIACDLAHAGHDRPTASTRVKVIHFPPALVASVAAART